MRHIVELVRAESSNVFEIPSNLLSQNFAITEVFIDNKNNKLTEDQYTIVHNGEAVSLNWHTDNKVFAVISKDE